MKHLFAPDGAKALALAMACQPLLAFDFDGTLAPIVAQPEAARIPPSVARRLALLARRLPMAIITGRRVADVSHRLPFEPQFIIGNHGAETPGVPASNETVVALDGLRERLQLVAADLLNAGVTVEDKRYSIALHYRRAYDPDRALGLIQRLMSSLDTNLVATNGKRVVNVTAAAAPDKAQAIASLVKLTGARAVVFAGDDINDEPVFVRVEPSWLTVRVGRELPTSQAKFCLNHAGEVPGMLDRMLGLLG